MLLVIGGHSRNIGKTSVACGIIKSLPNLNWTALKITQDPKHDTAEQCRWLEEDGQAPNSDSGRFLASGAQRAFWVRCPAGRLDEAIPRLETIIAASQNVIIESNSILQFLKPDLFIMVLDGAVPDFKPSSQRYLARADILAITSSAPLVWPGIPDSLLSAKPHYLLPAPTYQSATLNQAILNLFSQPADTPNE